MKTHTATAAYRGASPWTRWQRVQLLLWEYVWAVTCRWTPKPFNGWRLTVLRLFGARVSGRPFVHQRARIQIPWNLVLGDGACIGDRANLYSLATIVIGPGAVVAQEAYLCTGTHDFTHEALPLMTAPIFVGARSFVGARAFVLAGVRIGDSAVIGACSVVTREVPDRTTVAGNPARAKHTTAEAGV